jgi:hypothetical protein
MMKFKFVSMAAAAALIGGPASADPFVDAVVKNLQDLGYRFVEIERGATQLRAEGVRGNEELEVIYDIASGRILQQETGRADDDYIGRTGVELNTVRGDFLDSAGRELDEDRGVPSSGGTVAAGTPSVVDPTRTGDAFADRVIADLRAQGYGFVEIYRGAKQLRAEGVRGNEEIEVIYDVASGRILKQETGRADDDYIGRTGVELNTVRGDFLDSAGREIDDDWDDGRDDDDNDRDDRNDDRNDDRDDDRDDDRSGRDDDDDDHSGSGSGGHDGDDRDDDNSGSDRDDDNNDDDSGSDDNDDDNDNDDD